MRFLKMWYVWPAKDLISLRILEHSMNIKLLTKQHLEFLSLKGGCPCSSESTLVKMPHFWKSHVTAHIIIVYMEPCWTANFTFRKFHTVKNWYQFFTAREKLVPIRHIFITNVSHFVKFAHVVKCYVAYMRKQIPQSLMHFALDSNSSHICQDFITWFKQIADKFCFTVEKSGTGVRLQINHMSRVARKRFFGVHALDSQASVHVETNTSLLSLDWQSLEIFQSVQEIFHSV